MFNRKNMILTLIVVLAISLVGCSGANNTADTGDSAKQESDVTELTFWSWYAQQGPAIEAVVKEFEKDNPKVKVKVEYFETGAYPEQIKTSFISGNAPDIMGVEPGSGPKGLVTFKDAGRVLDLTDIYQEKGWNDRFYESAIKQLTFDGSIYSVPLTVNNMNLYYNKTLFDEFGLKAPKTFDDLYKVSEVLKENGILPITWGNKYQWTGKDYFFLFAGQQDTTLIKKAERGEIKWTDERLVKALNTVKRLSKDEVYAPGTNAMSDWDAIQLFFQEQAAMFFSGTWAIPNIKNNAPEGFTEQLGLIQFPIFENGLNHVSPGGVGMNVAISKDTKHKELAIKFLDYFTKTQSQKIFVKEAQFTSPNKEANVDEIVESHLLKKFNEFQGDTTPRSLVNSKMDAELGGGIQALIEGEMTAKEVLEKVEAVR